MQEHILSKYPHITQQHPHAAIRTCILVYTIFGIDILVIFLFPIFFTPEVASVAKAIFAFFLNN